MDASDSSGFTCMDDTMAGWRTRRSDESAHMDYQGEARQSFLHVRAQLNAAKTAEVNAKKMPHISPIFE